MRTTILILSALFGLASAAIAQNTGNEAVRVLKYEADRRNGQVNVNYVLGYDNLVLERNQQLTVTPLIVNRGDTTALPPVVFRGGTREKVEERKEDFYGYPQGYTEPYELVAFTNQELRERKRAAYNAYRADGTEDDIIDYRYSVNYKPSMEGAMVILENELDGCGDIRERWYTNLGPVREPVQPRVLFIIPEYEQIKARAENITAHVNFQVDKYEIRRDIADNDRELDRIYNFTEKIANNDDLEISKIRIKGYASPEASYAHNTRLASNRVNALKENLKSRYGLGDDMFIVDYVPEDWDSLRSWVADSNIRYRSEILNIIDSTPDPDARDGKIKALDNGSTYKMLLADVYPQLRRTDYAIDYVVAPFTVETGRALIFTDPRLMSLNEMYMVADSYPHDSREFEEAMRVMVRYYPNDVVANNNMAAFALERGDHQTAHEYLVKFKDDPRCHNNLGIIAARNGEAEAAANYFRWAAEQGSTEAQYNLSNLQYLD